MQCETCGKEAKSKAGLAAHMRSHATPEAPPENVTRVETVKTTTIPAYEVVREMKGWKAWSDNSVTNKEGVKVGTFPSQIDAVRFLENTYRTLR